MKPIFEIRRDNRKRSARSKSRLTKGERRRLLQLAISLIIFAVALLGRDVFPERLECWDELLYRNADFESAFSKFGESAAQGEPLWNSLSELCVEVFGGNEVHIRESAPIPIFHNSPSVSERCREWGRYVRLNEPDNII